MLPQLSRKTFSYMMVLQTFIESIKTFPSLRKIKYILLNGTYSHGGISKITLIVYLKVYVVLDR